MSSPDPWPLATEFLVSECRKIDRHFNQSSASVYLKAERAPTTCGQVIPVLVAARQTYNRHSPGEFTLRVYRCAKDMNVPLQGDSCFTHQDNERAFYALLAEPPVLVFEKLIRPSYVAARAA